MGAYKQFLASDITVVPFEVNKSFSFSGNQLTGSDVSIERYLGKNLSGSLFNPLTDPTTGIIYPQYQRLVYDSVKELYYSNYLSSSYGSPATTQSLVPGSTPEGNVFVGPTDSSGKYFNYNQTTLTFEKFFPTSSGEEIVAISVPSRLYGNYIQPSSFIFNYSSSLTIYDDGQGNLYSSASFTWVSSSFQEFFYSESVRFISFDNSTQITLESSNPPAEYTFVSASWLGLKDKTPFRNSDLESIEQIDDQGIIYDPSTGEMISTGSIYSFADTDGDKGPIELLFYSSSITNTSFSILADENIGNIFYPHGMAVFTNQNLPLSDITTLNNVTCSFSSSLTIWETQYKCTIRENEYTLTQNPSALSGSDGSMYSFVTAPYFSPYVTTVGLYDDEQNLLAIGKLSQPLPTSPTTDTTIVINIDR